MLIDVPEDVAAHLQSLAQQRGTDVGDLLKALLADYIAPPQTDTPPAGSLAEMAQNARSAGLASATPTDTVDRSREILQSEYAEYLKQGTGQDNSA